MDEHRRDAPDGIYSPKTPAVMNSNATDSALAWWRSISESERERLQTKFKSMFDIPLPINNDDIVHIWESEGWPEP